MCIFQRIGRSIKRARLRRLRMAKVGRPAPSHYENKNPDKIDVLESEIFEMEIIDQSKPQDVRQQILLENVEKIFTSVPNQSMLSLPPSKQGSRKGQTLTTQHSLPASTNSPDNFSINTTNKR